MIKITIEKNKIIEVPQGTRIMDLFDLAHITNRDNIIAAKLNDIPVDLTRELTTDSTLTWIMKDTEEGLDIYRHSSSHLLAHAVKELYPDVQIGVGPAVEDGFYYDFLKKDPFTPEDLLKIEAKMRELTAQGIAVERILMPKEEACAYFKKQGESLKVELIEEKGGAEVSCYKQGSFMDFCLGPHVHTTKAITAFKLLSIAGAYWKGLEKNPQLQRIYGTSFFNQQDLETYLKKIEEAHQRDHRKLGKELDLFSVQESIGPGLILWHPRGAQIRRIIEDFWYSEHYKRGYDVVYTPHIARVEQWQTSGHWSFYRENMYSPMDIDEMKYVIKPMNCPFHLMIYKNKLRSYRDLPFRWAELGTVYRYERSGVMHGLMRVRGFTQDDAHIFCRQDQLKDEIIQCLNFSKYLFASFGFPKYHIYLSTRPENFVGEVKNWDLATETLKSALEETQTDYSIDRGEGVFYGPKIDIKIEDVIGRSWQCTTIQVDFNLPQRFDLNYIGQDGNQHQVIMVHRALLGSMERFFGVLIEHYGGAFPLWLSPVQVVILPIAERHHEHAHKLLTILRSQGLRTELDERNEKLNYKIREAQHNKIPFMTIIGDKEVQNNTLSIRSRSEADIGSFSIDEFVQQCIQLTNNKSMDLNIRG